MGIWREGYLFSSKTCCFYQQLRGVSKQTWSIVCNNGGGREEEGGGHGMLSLSVSANEGKVGQKKYLISSGGRG